MVIAYKLIVATKGTFKVNIIGVKRRNLCTLIFYFCRTIMSNMIVRCPKCKTENLINILKAEEGSRILCKGCNEFITITFNGKPPGKVIDDFRKNLRKSLPRKIIIKL